MMTTMMIMMLAVVVMIVNLGGAGQGVRDSRSGQIADNYDGDGDGGGGYGGVRSKAVQRISRKFINFG